MQFHHVGGRRRGFWSRRSALAVLLMLGAAPRAEAGRPFTRAGQPRGTVVTPSARVVPAPGATLNSYGRLGTFYPTPYMMVRGNAPAGGGYSPLGEYGETTLSLYGPLSSLRFT